MIEKNDMAIASPFDRLRLAIIGKEKSGKSRLAATGRKAVLFADFDKRREAVAGINDVYAATFTDAGGHMMPTAFSELIDLVVALEKSRKLTDLGFTPRPGATITEVKTFVLDSVQTVAKSAMDYALYNNKDLTREIKVGSMSVKVPKSFDGWGAEMNMMDQIVLRLLGIQGLDVIIILHETAEEAADSTAEKPRYTGKVGVFPARYQRLLKYFNEVWRVTRDQNIPKVQIIADYSFTAATNLNLSGTDNVPDIQELITKSLGQKALTGVK